MIIRAGYGRELSQKDEEFETHYKNAKAAGFKIGAYWYSYADSVADAEKEAKACLECVKGKTFDLPIFYDLEDSSQMHLGKATLTEIAEKFCEILKSAGYSAGVYANLNWFKNLLNYDYLKEKYAIWLAQYNSTADLKCDIWQNSSTGKINGVSGNCDTNIIFNHRITEESGNDNNITKPPYTKIPDIYYRVRCEGRWLPEVKNLTDFAGIQGKAVTDIAVRASVGSLWYQVHVKGGEWLPRVTGYDTADIDNGFAGNGEVIDAVRIYYDTPKSVADSLGRYLRARYRVSAVNATYFDYQYDNETENSQDGYAGVFGKPIDRLQIVLE